MTLRLLLAEDDPMLRKALGNLLTRSGYAVTAVDDGEPAIELSEKTAFDIVIADFNMGKVGGVAVIRHYKQKYGTNIFCMVLSGDDDELMSAACYMAGADDVLTKPASPKELRQRLQNATAALRTRAA